MYILKTPPAESVNNISFDVRLWEDHRIYGYQSFQIFLWNITKYFEESSQCYIEWCHFQRWEIISSCKFKTEFRLLGAWHFKRPSSQINYFVLDPGSRLEEFLNSFTNSEFKGIKLDSHYPNLLKLQNYVPSEFDKFMDDQIHKWY